MKYGASIRSRHIVAKFDKGEEFMETMLRLCGRERIRAAIFEGTGSFCSAELQEYNPQNQRYEGFFKSETCMQVPSLHGSVSVLGTELIVDVQCILKYAIFGQTHLIAGNLRSARVHCIELHITMFDDLIIERSFDMATGLAPWSKIQSTLESEYSDSASALGYLSSSNRLEAALNNDDTNLSRPPKVLRRKLRQDDDSVLPQSDAKSGLAGDVPAAAPSAGPESMSEEDFNASTRGEWLKAKRRVAASQASGESNMGILRSSDLRVAAPKARDATTHSEAAVGDILEHPALGRCRLEAPIDDDTARVSVEDTGEPKVIRLQGYTLQALEHGVPSVFRLVKN